MIKPRPDEEAPLLIVDPYPDGSRTMGCLLWLNGYDCEGVGTNAAARQRLAASRFSLVLCRNAMPDGNAAEMIEHAWRTYGTPGVAVTGTMTAEQLAARVASDGLRGVVVIPANQQQLLVTVARALGREDIVGPHHRNAADVAKAPCCDCHGTGQVTLLVSRKPCRTCGGSGGVRLSVVDWPIRHWPIRNDSLLPPLRRFALYWRGVRTVRQAATLSVAELKDALAVTDTAAEELRGGLRKAVAECPECPGESMS